LSEKWLIKTWAAASQAFLAAGASAPKLVPKSDVNVGVMITMIPFQRFVI
jgi:hypothetical protein